MQSKFDRRWEQKRLEWREEDKKMGKQIKVLTAFYLLWTAVSILFSVSVIVFLCYLAYLLVTGLVG